MSWFPSRDRAAAGTWCLASLVVALTSVPAASAGSIEEPEIVDLWKDVALQPGDVVPPCTEPACSETDNGEPGDVGSAWIGPENSTWLQFNAHVNATPQANTLGEWTFTFHWTFENASFEAWATMDHETGELHCGGLAAACAIRDDGEAHTNVEFHVQKSAFGDPPTGAVLTDTWAQSNGTAWGLVDGFGASDRAPDSGFGTDYIVVGARPTAEPVRIAAASPSANHSLTNAAVASIDVPKPEDPPTQAATPVGAAIAVAALLAATMVHRHRS